MTIHKEKRDRIEDKNKVIVRLNKTIQEKEQELMFLRSKLDFKPPPIYAQVLLDKGTHYQTLEVIRQSQIDTFRWEIIVQ